MAWEIIYSEAAKRDFNSLYKSQSLPVVKAIRKVAVKPFPNSEGGYGKPLGKHVASNLTGFLKIKLVKQGLRVIYKIERERRAMRIVIISVRSDDKVYRQLQERINKGD